MSKKIPQLTKVTPNWVLCEILPGAIWDIGMPDNPTKVPHLAGFYDFRYLILRQFADVNLLELPGVSVSKWLHLDSSGGVREVYHGNNSYVTSGAFTGFSSDNVADAQTLRELRAERIKLQAGLDEPYATPEELDAIKDELEELEKFSLDHFVPGGDLKKLNLGDPLDKAVGAARKRKSRAVAKLKEFGLEEIADHWQRYYTLKPRSCHYSPLGVRPNWHIYPIVHTESISSPAYIVKNEHCLEIHGDKLADITRKFG